MAESELTEIETLTYLGRRMTRGDSKVSHVFQNAEGERRWFRRKVHSLYVIGKQYEIKCDPDRETFAIGGTYKPFVGEHPDRDEVQRWRAEDRATALEVESRSQVAKLKREESHNIGDLTLAQLRRLYASQPGGTVATIMRYLNHEA